MNLLLIAAAVLAIAIGAAHSWLGERYLIMRLLRRDSLPKLFGTDVFTRQTIRFAWHLTTIAWCGLAALLLLLAGALPGLRAGTGALHILAATFASSAGLSLVLTRGRHLSWVVFLAIAALCVAAAG